MDYLNKILSFEERKVRVVGTNEDPWFCGRDVTIILGYKDVINSLKEHVDKEDKNNLQDITSKRVVNYHPLKFNKKELSTIYINESGLYSLILRSKLEKAKEFKRWITSEVLPSIRKQGQYVLQKQLKEKDEECKKKDEECKKKDEECKKKDEQLKIKEKQLEREKIKNMNIQTFINNVKLREKTEYVYIATTNTYAKFNQFKLGSSTRLEHRLRSYNTGRPVGDKYYYAWIFKCSDSRLLEKTLSYFLKDWKDTNQAEMFVLHYNFLLEVVEFICDNFDKSTDFINHFIKKKIPDSYDLEPVIPEPLILDKMELRVIRNGSEIRNKVLDLSKFTDEERIKIIEEKFVEFSRDRSEVNRQDFLVSLESSYKLDGLKRYIWNKLKDISKPKQLALTY